MMAPIMHALLFDFYTTEGHFTFKFLIMRSKISASFVISIFVTSNFCFYKSSVLGCVLSCTLQQILSK